MAILDVVTQFNIVSRLPPQPIFWAENGTHTWKAASMGVAKALNSQGLLETTEVAATPLAEAAKLMGAGERKIAAIWGSK